MPIDEDGRLLRRNFAMAIREGRWNEAVELGQQILNGSPDDALGWFNLAFCLRALRRFEEAMNAYAKAIALGVDRPEEAMINRAHILIEHLLRPKEAERELVLALEHAPNSLAALLSLGQLQEDHGNATSAEATYQTILRVHPACGRAAARLSGIWRSRGESDRALDLLTVMRSRLPAAKEDFAEVSAALGQLLEARGQHAAAFEAYDQAKRAVIATKSPGARYSVPKAEETVARIVAAPAPLLNKAAGDQRPGPIFVCGMFRSGSTLVESILARHPRVTAAGELETIPALAAEIAGYPVSLASLAEADVAAMRVAYWAEIDDRFGETDLVVDKRPDNFLHLGLIRRLFPDSPILHTVRDGDDVALSIFSNLFGEAVPYADSLRDIRHWQSVHERVMSHWLAAFSDAILDLSYEALIANPEREIRQLLDFCGLDWSPACLDHRPGSMTVRTLSQWQVRDGINAKSVNRAEPFRHFLHQA